MRVALLHNARPLFMADGLPDDAFEEFDTPETIESVANALRLLKIEVEALEAGRDLPWRLEAGDYDFVFNIAEGRGRRCREGIPAAVCELLGIPFTGSDMLTLAITLDKDAARRLVSPEVPVARATLIDGEPCQKKLAAMAYPVFVKPNDEGSSKGIRDQSIAYDLDAAMAITQWLRAHYRCPVLVEEFLPGAEVTVGVAGNGCGTRVLGMMEIAPEAPAAPWAYTLDVKREWRRRVGYHVPPRLDSSTRALIEGHALTAYRLLGCRDLARLDFRLDAAGTAHFLECNPLPGLNAENSDIAILSQATVAYNDLVQGVLIDAANRWNFSLPKGHA